MGMCLACPGHQDNIPSWGQSLDVLKKVCSGKIIQSIKALKFENVKFKSNFQLFFLNDLTKRIRVNKSRFNVPIMFDEIKC